MMEKTSVWLEVESLCRRAQDAAPMLAASRTAQRNRMLLTFARLLRENRAEILAANETDLSHAEENGVRPAMLDRLRLTEERIASIACGAEDVAALPDPIGKGECWTRPNGLVIRHTRVPLGVVGAIFEARPNVSADIAVLCIKSGNCAVLRGGKEAIHSNRVIVSLCRRAAKECGFPEDVVCLVENTSRESSAALMQMRGIVDVLVPRGGKGLIRAVVENASVPVIETGAGNCHIYVHDDADTEMACRVIVNAKTSRPAVCNACETVLVHRDIAASFLPMLAEALRPSGCEMRGCPRTLAVLPEITAATETDWETEYDDLILAVRVVDSLAEATAHIGMYSTHHSEAILTRSIEAAEQFCASVDSAAVYVNASTRFTDGGEFGFGAELGISTQKLHARGPMGLAALTTEKYRIDGCGQIR